MYQSSWCTRPIIVILHIVVKDTLSACCIRIKCISLTDHNQRSNHYFSFRDNFHSPRLLLSKLEAFFSQMLLQEETEFKLLNHGRTRNVYRNNFFNVCNKITTRIKWYWTLVILIFPKFERKMEKCQFTLQKSRK